MTVSRSMAHSNPSLLPLRSGENLINLSSHLVATRWLQIAHGRLHVRMTEPLLHRPQIHSSPQASSRKGRPELVQPKVVLVELRTCRACFQTVEKIRALTRLWSINLERGSLTPAKTEFGPAVIKKIVLFCADKV